MAQTYLLFDFGSDEQKVQQARHKLEGWKQAFRLDKKLQYKFERQQTESAAGESSSEDENAAAKSEKATSPKSKGKSPSTKSKTNDLESPAENHGDVKLLVRLYFSGHEKLSEQRWLDRIPAEDPFKSASPKVIRENEPAFTDTVKQFDSLE